MYFGFWDVTYILVIIGAIFSMMASAHVQAVYSRYARVRSRSGLTGAQAAQMILQKNDVSDVAIGHVSGNLTDHYDPSKQQVNLSDTTYGSESVAAVAVAAHECGHVMQNHTGYVPLQIRSAMAPITNIGTNIGLWIAILSIIFGLSQTLTDVGILLYSLGFLFTLVTLPVEFNASHRALVMLEDYGMLTGDENKEARSVLTAAALTYVAAATASLLSLLRLILLAGGRRRSD